MTRRSEHLGWLVAAVGLLVYAFLYDNATSLPTAMGYGWTRLTPLPRQVRVLEIGVIMAMLALALGHGVSSMTRNLLTGCVAFVGLGLISYLRSSNIGLLDGVRLIYMWVLPVLLFVIGREGPFGRRAWNWLAATVLVWVLLSAAISWLQFAVLGYPVGDDITGLNKDAHANGTLLMFAALQLLALALFYERRSALLLALALLATMVLSSVLKVMFLSVVALALLVWLYLRFGPRQRAGLTPRGVKLAMAAALVVLVVSVAFTQVDLISSDRLGDLPEKFRNDPQSLGPIRAHEAAGSKIVRDLPTLLLGMGPFRFANPISVGQVLTDARLARSASGELLAVDDEKGEETRITLTSSLLGEFGLPAFVIVGLIYLTVARAVWRGVSHARFDIQARTVGLIACGSILAMVPLASLFGSLDVMSVSWPVTLLSGVICREAALSPPAPASAGP